MRQMGDTRQCGCRDTFRARAIANAVLVEHVDPSTNVPLTFTLPLRNEEELDTLLQRMYDPSDKQHYQKYLTPDEFHARFSPTEADYNKVIAYAESLGLTVTGKHPNRLLLNVSGSARAVERGFGLRLHRYKQPDGRTFHAPNNNPQVSRKLRRSSAASSAWIPMLYGARTTGRKRPLEIPTMPTGNVSPSGPNNGYAPSDLLSGLRPRRRADKRYRPIDCAVRTCVVSGKRHQHLHEPFRPAGSHVEERDGGRRLGPTDRSRGYPRHRAGIGTVAACGDLRV